MKNILTKILKIALIVALFLLVAMVVFGLVLSLDWPWWVGVFILGGILGLTLAVILLKRLWARRSEQQFVSQVIEQDEARLNQVDVKEAESMRELQGRWKEAVEALKSSHLKKFGNPLYVLPWYMILGESGSGKTTAIKSARLSSPFAEVTRTSGLSGTRNCDWWFFKQAIIIDTAGRYAVPVVEDRDKSEWHKFLGLLTKYRKKEPINGLVITIGCDRLRDMGAEALGEMGASLRKRIDELMRVLGARFPVYVLVTKCDLIQGMTQFCDRLTETTLQQAMGVINRQSGAAGFLEGAFKTIAERLRDLRLVILHKSSTEGFAPRPAASPGDPELVLFPDEFERLKPALEAFFAGCFQENPYQETPILRGIYFSSGRQEGTPYSHFLQALGLIEQRDVLPGTDRGLFLHDLFSRVLPFDRSLFTPTHRTIRWGRLTRNIGLSAWVTVVIALCGLLSFSFVKNLQIIRGVSGQFAAPPVLEGDIITILDKIERYRGAIAQVESKNQNWWIPRFGLNESIEVEHHLKNSYCAKFRNELATYYDNRLEGEMSRLGAGMSDAVLGRYAAHLARRINLLKTGLAGENPTAFKNLPQPAYEPALLMADNSLAPEIDTFFSGLNHSYLAWNTDTGQLTEELQILQSWLAYILSIRKTSINWLVDWANANPGLTYFRLETFWGDDLTGTDTVSIPPAFTGDGKQLIDGLIEEIETALADPMDMAEKKPAFNRWYNNAYVKVWHDFGEHFPKGEYWLRDRTAWQRLAMTMAQDQGPYFALLDRMAAELKSVPEQRDRTPWFSLVKDLKAAQMTAVATKGLQKSGVLEKAAQTGKKLLEKLDTDTGGSKPVSAVSANLVAAKAYKEYREALHAMTLAAESQKVAYEMTVEYFSEDPATSETAFFSAFKALKRLKASLGEGFVEQEMFWRLVTGPLYFMRDYVNLESACYLNRLWEQDVLVEIKGMFDKTAVNQRLFGAEGYATKFIKGPAEPFLRRNLEQGYYARETLDRRLPFTEDFLFFLTRSTEISKFKPKFETDLARDTNIAADDDTAALLKILLMKDRGTGSTLSIPDKPAPGTGLKPPGEPPPVALADSYAVKVKCLPTDVNAGARIKPHAAVLEMDCGDQQFELVNLQYPRTATFEWVPKKCHELRLTIEIGGTELTKRYTGERTFLRFMEDFSNGKRIFKLEEFGRNKKPIARQGVKYFKLNYQFEGHEPLLDIIDREKARQEKIEAARKDYQKRKAEARKTAAANQQAQDAEMLMQLKRELAAQQANQAKTIKQILEDWEARKALKEIRERQASEALKARKKQMALQAKEAWEKSIPEVPRDIVVCWDQ